MDWLQIKWKIDREINFVNDKMEGKELHYEKSGKLEEEVNYVNNKREGKWICYFE